MTVHQALAAPTNGCNLPNLCEVAGASVLMTMFSHSPVYEATKKPSVPMNTIKIPCTVIGKLHKGRFTGRQVWAMVLKASALCRAEGSVKRT